MLHYWQKCHFFPESQHTLHLHAPSRHYCLGGRHCGNISDTPCFLKRSAKVTRSKQGSLWQAMIREFVSVQDRKRRKAKKMNYQSLASAFFPVNPREFTLTMESGPGGQIKSFQCRTYRLFIFPGSHCCQKCHDCDQKAKQLTLRAQLLLIHGDQMPGQAILSQ